MVTFKVDCCGPWEQLKFLLLEWLLVWLVVRLRFLFIGTNKPAGKGPQLQLSTPVISVFQVKHYGLKKRQKCKPVCTICRKGFKSWKEQAEHWKRKHTNKDEYKCNKCNKEFGSASNYKKNTCCSTRRKRKRLFAMNVDNILVIHLNWKAT